MQSLIIHMPGPGARADNVARLLKVLPMARVVPAVDGREALAQPDIDVRSGDRFGRLALSREGIAARDRFVIESVLERGLPLVLLLSGGYAATPEETADLHAIMYREAFRAANGELRVTSA